jgi:hypothetical protein
LKLRQASLAVILITVFIDMVGIATATGIVGSPVAAMLFAYFIRPDAPFIFPGVAFMLGAVLFLLALLFIRRTPEDRRLAAGSAVNAG